MVAALDSPAIPDRFNFNLDTSAPRDGPATTGPAIPDRFNFNLDEGLWERLDGRRTQP